MPFARIWRCVKQNFAGSAASSALSPRVLQEEVQSGDWRVSVSFSDFRLSMVNLPTLGVLLTFNGGAVQGLDCGKGLASLLVQS